MENKKIYYPMGIMSGSSLDGLDLALCKIELINDIIEWEILESETIPFDDVWVNRLKNLSEQSAIVYAKTNTYFSYYVGDMISSFILKHNINPDFLAFHGHTIFHNPKQLMTAQIGNGGALASRTGYPVICDSRTTDIGLNGEGAPLAPLADKYLFSEYDFCLNIGGIANITNVKKNLALDVSPANQILNFLANELDMEFDKDGETARKGNLNKGLATALNEFKYYKIEGHKSLDNNEIKKYFFPLLSAYNCSTDDKLHTSTQHISNKICDYIRASEIDKPRIICTGGGAFNEYLIEILNQDLSDIGAKFIVPDDKTVNFKEALLMALMGVFRVQNMTNTISSATGAHKDTIGGAIYQGTNKLL